MLTPDQDRADFSWRVLIRARYAFHVDSVIAGVIQRAVVPLLPAGMAADVSTKMTAATANAIVQGSTGKARMTRISDEQFGSACRAVAAFDDEHPCGTPWPRRYRIPGIILTGTVPDTAPATLKDLLPSSGFTEAGAALVAAADLVEAVGSAQLREHLSPVLKEALGDLCSGADRSAASNGH